METDGNDNGIRMEAKSRVPKALGKCIRSYEDEGSVESHRYYLAHRTLLEMLRDRGYAVSSSELSLSLEDFRAKYGQIVDTDRLRISTAHRNDPSKRILAIFCGSKTVKVNEIRSLSSQITNQSDLSSLIVVLQGSITNQAQRALDLFPFRIETFQIGDLLVNITKHVLKPKHRVLSDQEKQNLLKKYSILEKQLPRMLKTDAIARYYGLTKGQVVKITYSGEITRSHVSYRCVW
ncbi:hypothetical protein MLD38_033206 [Melastoma candidum]|uniref:Uncharacterized protein n=1 Tax=Melastoma candidum TaxID=119954 RepID=A0ACB9M602_9MYRT|nr:hypothetical protein MLD38_033206 [Melastoma candidum]